MSIKILFLSAFLLLSACGFSPIYGENAPRNDISAKSTLDQIEIAIIPNREGQYLRNLLIDRFYSNGYPATPRYRLNISPIRERVIDFDITIDDEATRRQLQIDTGMKLIDTAQNNKTILSRPLSAITSHNVLESEYSTIVTEQSAREAALKDIARQVELQIILFLNRQ